MAETRQPERQDELSAFYDRILSQRMRRREVLTAGIKGAALVAGGAGLASLLGACANTATQTPGTSAAGGSAASYNRNFNGVTLNVAVGSFMSTGATLFIDQWQKDTGGKVNVIQIPFGDLYAKLYSAFTSGVGAYDIAIYASNWIPEFQKGGYLLNLEKYYPLKTNWGSVLPNVQRIMYVNGARYSVPMDGDLIFGYYRRDALENTANQQKFQTKYGYALKPPTTWQEYHDIAEFFTGWDWAGSGKPGFGVLEAFGPKDVDPYIYVTRAAAYSAHPDLPNSLFFDPDTMKPQVANPGWIRALDEWKALIPFGPSQMVTYGGGDERGNFPAGDYALTIDWADTGIQSMDPKASKIRDKLGYFLAPGAKEVYNYKTSTFDQFPNISYAPYQGWGGWHASVVASTKNPDAAWDFADWLDTSPNALTAVTTGGTARNPYRTDHFNPQPWIDGPMKYVDPKPYLDTMMSGFTNKNAQNDLRIPGGGQYFNSLDKWIQLAISGQMTSKDALTQCAAEWETITNQFGRDSQKSYYQSLSKTS